MKIAICDDNRDDIDIIKAHINSQRLVHEIIEFTSALPFIKRIYDGEHFDLLFLDVQMPDSDGWEIAKELKQRKVKVFIVMITVLDGYIFDCFDRVDWFVPKPASAEKIKKIIECACQKLNPKVLEFKANGIAVSLTAQEIIYFEVQHNDLHIHSVHSLYKTRLSLCELENLLSEMLCFARVHQSFIINLNHYEKKEGNDLILKNGQKLALSRSYRNTFFNALADYVRGC